DAHGQVGSDHDYIPQDGRLDSAIYKEVPESFGAAHVHHDDDGCEQDGRYGNDFRYPHQWRSPGHIREFQDGTDEGTHQADGDEENEVGNINSPGRVVAHVGYNQPVAKLLDICNQPGDDYNKQKPDPQLSLQAELLWHQVCMQFLHFFFGAFLKI